MADTASAIIDRLFERAATDKDAAPLAAEFEGAYRSGQWNTETLDARWSEHIELAMSNSTDDARTPEP